jgi:hypothetical protein
MCGTIHQQKRLLLATNEQIFHSEITLEDPPKTKYQEVIAEIKSEVVEIRSDWLRVSHDNAFLNHQMSEMKNEESQLRQKMNKRETLCAVVLCVCLLHLWQERVL